jgi:hypothetical protein
MVHQMLRSYALLEDLDADGEDHALDLHVE